jgi:hypothetical protein
MEPKRRWYQMKRTWLGAGLIAFSALLNSSDRTPASNLVQPGLNSSANVIQTVQQKTNETVKDPKTVETRVNKTRAPETNTTNLSNNNYYTNVNGSAVHSPAYSEDGSIPAGASAKCGDGTYSFSQHRQGTCSRHGGVSVWY